MARLRFHEPVFASANRSAASSDDTHGTSPGDCERVLMPAEPPPPLTYEQTARMLAKLDNLEHPIVLVGGQAVNFWAELYLNRAPALAAQAPYTSKDIDFCGPPGAVRECAARLGGRAHVATFDEMGTPNTGTVTFVDDDGFARTIDFLKQPAGLNARETFETSFPAEILDDEGRPIATFRVMHPLLSLESRAHNVAHLPGYQTDHAKNQVRAAILCAREYVRDQVTAGATRRALNANERIFEIATSRAGVLIYLRHGLDVFAAVFAEDGLSAAFYAKRLPQMQATIARIRARAARLGHPRA